MPDKIMVTGATGKVGAPVVEQLAATGATILAAVQATSKTEAIKKAGATPVVIDFASAESIRSAFKGADKLFLLTPVSQNQVAWSATVVDAARQANIGHIVKLSVMGADWERPTIFGAAHAQMERHIVESGVPYTFLRPTFFMQNFLGEATIKAEGVFYGCVGDARSSPIDTRDIAAVATAALTRKGHEGRSYDLTGPELLSQSEIASILSSVIGRTVRYVDLTDDQVRSGMRSAGLPEWLIESLLDLSLNHREGRFARLSHAVEEVTGRKPITFERFFADHLESFK